METRDSIEMRSKRVRSALEGAFGVRARTLDKALRKTGRRLPKRLRADARLIVEAEAANGNPRRLRQFDTGALDRAEGSVVTWLDAVDRADRRKGMWIGIGAMIGFNLLIAIAGVVVWMWWTGRV